MWSTVFSCSDESYTKFHRIHQVIEGKILLNRKVTLSMEYGGGPLLSLERHKGEKKILQ